MDTSVKGLIANSKKRIGAVHPGVMERMEILTERCKARGVDVVFTQGLRTMVDQARLYGQGRNYSYKGVNYSQPNKPIVTKAEPGTSIHNYGLALDFAIVKNDSEFTWDTNADLDKDGVRDWMEVVAEAKKLGFEWGGDWVSFKDYAHIEWVGNLNYAQIFAGKKPIFPAIKNSGTTPVKESTTSKPSTTTKTITVKSGDTLSAIAVKYGTTVTAIKKANGLKSDLITVGQKLKVAAKVTTVSKPATSGVYTVKSGDTLSAIAVAKNTTVAKLKSKNGLKSDLITVGQKLKY